MINGPTRPRTLFNSSTYRLSRRRRLQAQPLAVLSLVLGMILGSNSANAEKMLGVGVEASTTVDDNVTRGYGDGNVLSDKFLGINLSKGLHYPISHHTRVAVLGFLGLNGYFEYTDLSHYYAGAQGEFQYRPSGSFYAPTFALLVRTAIEEYQSEVRDSYRSSAALSVRKPITDKFQLFGTLTYNRRDGKSAVFDTSDISIRVSSDFAATPSNTIYLGLEYRDGDIVSTGRPSTAYTDIAEAIVLDDAFNDTTRYAYKIDGSSWLLNLGYNFAINERQALDASWRMVNATPSAVAGASAAAGRIHYTVNQFSLAYMVRF